MTNVASRRKSSISYNIADAKAQLSNIVREVLAGEDVVIAKDNKPLVRVVPLRDKTVRRAPGSGRGQVTISADFDAPLEDFADYS